MRNLTAAQKVAHLELRIAKLEREAGVFDSFKGDILKDAVNEIYSLLAENFEVESSGFPTLKNQGRSQMAILKMQDEAGSILKLMVMVGGRGDKIIAGVKGSSSEIVEIGSADFSTMDSRRSVRELILNVEKNLPLVEDELEAL